MSYEKKQIEIDDLSDTISDAEDALHPGYRVDAEHSLLECIENMTKKMQWYDSELCRYMQMHEATTTELRDRDWKESGINGR